MADGKISKLAKLVLGGALAGGLFFGYNLLEKGYIKPNNDISNFSLQYQDKTKQIAKIKNLEDIKKKDDLKLKDNNYEVKSNLNKKTIVHKIIQIQNGASPNFLVLGSLTTAKVDSAIKRIEDFIPKKPVSEITKREAGDLFLKIDSVTENLIFKGTAQCYQTTLIYHAIGEIYDLPIKMVVAPPFTNEEYHSFARWDPDGKHDASNQDNPINQGDFNWDNESKDFIKYGFQQNGFPQNVDDEYFIREFYVPKKTLEERIYLKNMNEKEMLAFFGYWIKSEIYLAKMGQAGNEFVTRPEKLTEKEENKYLERYYKKIDEIYMSALKSINTALKLDPSRVPSLFTKARMLGQYANNKIICDYKEARNSIDKAIGLNSEQPELWCLKGVIYRNSADFDGSFSKEEQDSLFKEAIKSSNISLGLIKKRKEIEFQKKDNPGGINYNKLYYLAKDEQNYLFSKEMLYFSLKKKCDNKEDSLKYAAEENKINQEYNELSKEIEIYKKKAHQRIEKINNN